MEHGNFLKILGRTLAAAWLATACQMPASAQGSNADLQFLNRIYEASNSVDEDTARDAFKTCQDLGAELSARQDMEAGVKLYFEAQIESCLAYAMSKGEFSDDAGNECSHHFAAAEKFADAILAAQNKPGVTQEQFANLREEFDRLTKLAPQRGCEGDYARLIQSLPSTDAIAPAN